MMSRQLSTLIEQALRDLAKRADGDLPLGWRQAVWATFGPHWSDVGRRRRTRLALASARSVESLWYEDNPNDDFLARCFRLAERLMKEPESPEGHKAADALWNEALLMTYDTPAIAAATAASNAAMAGAYDESFNENDLDTTRPDDINVDCGDAAYFAAWARAGGRVHDPRSDPEARRAFWRWWLTTAVPAAFESE
jgi:hypothetical protein